MTCPAQFGNRQHKLAPNDTGNRRLYGIFLKLRTFALEINALCTVRASLLRTFSWELGDKSMVSSAGSSSPSLMCQ
jgi:hypothetical protein